MTLPPEPIPLAERPSFQTEAELAAWRREMTARFRSEPLTGSCPPIRHDDGGLAKALEASTQGMRPRAGTWVPQGPWLGLQDSIVAANQARLREIDRD